jgi:hypothetical protein
MSPTLILLLATQTSSAAGAWIAAVIEGRSVLPSLVEVQEAAVEAMAIPTDEEAKGWAGRARLRGLVPDLELGVGTNEVLDVRDSYSGATSHLELQGQGMNAHATAKWTLGDLVFHDVELRANREALARAAAVRLVRDRVTRIYFERLEVLARQRHDRSPELALQAARLDGLLQVYTGGLLAPRGASGGKR